MTKYGATETYTMLSVQQCTLNKYLACCLYVD